jgi:putative DNA primase/helicase
LIDAPPPFYLIDAPTEGTGKGLLAKTLLAVATGREVPIQTQTSSSEEFRKRITALLAGGTRIAFLDNVTWQIADPNLAAALTANEWTDRVLGVTRTITVPNRAQWIATGNNAELSKEMARRTVRSRLDAKMEHPEDRNNVKYDLPYWALAKRSELIWATLVLIKLDCPGSS